MTKKNHFASEVYLKEFTDKDGILWVYQPEIDYFRKSKPRNEGFQKYLYRYTSKKGEKDTDSIEKFFDQHLETHMPDLFLKLSHIQSLQKTDLERIAMMVGFSITRTPAFLQKHYEHREAVKEKVIQRLQALTLPEFREEFTKLATAKGADLQVTDEELQQAKDTIKAEDFPTNREVLIVRIGDGLKAAALLRKMPWVFLKAPKGFTFLTSDDPVCKHGRNLKDPGIQVTFPITKDIAFFADHENRTQAYRYDYAIRQQVEAINQRTVEMADRFVYSPENSEAFRCMIKERFGLRKMEARKVYPPDPVIDKL